MLLTCDQEPQGCADDLRGLLPQTQRTGHSCSAPRYMYLHCVYDGWDGISLIYLKRVENSFIELLYVDTSSKVRSSSPSLSAPENN